jgi:hypothetical protein
MVYLPTYNGHLRAHTKPLRLKREANHTGGVAMNITTLGIDLAKNTFRQVGWVKERQRRTQQARPILAMLGYAALTQPTISNAKLGDLIIN